MKKALAITLALTVVAWSAWAADITVEQVKQNEGDQTVYATITDGADEYRLHGDTPKLEGAALQTYLDKRLERWLVLVLKNQYPGARYEVDAGETELQVLRDWIAAGHTNAAYCEGAEGADQQACEDNDGTWHPEEVIEKVPFKDTWEAEKVQAVSDMKQSVLYGKTDQQIQDYINANVTDMTSAKVYLYKLTKEVRDIIKRQGWE